MQPPAGAPPGGGPTGPTPPPRGPPGGYGVGLPPGVDPVTARGPVGPAGPTGSQQEVFGIVALVAGLLAVPFWFCCGAFSGAMNLVGLVLGFVSLSRVNSDPERYQGKGIAIAALVVNGVLLLASIVLAVFVFGMMGLGLLGSP